MRKSFGEIRQYLIDNATDYVDRSTDAYHEDDFKAATIFLWSGLLLFMKVELFDMDPQLIYKNYVGTTRLSETERWNSFQSFDQSGERRTVAFGEISEKLKRLHPTSEILKASIPLSRIQRVRNRIEHYIDDITQDEYSGIIHSVLPLISSLVEDDLELEPSTLFRNWGALLEIEAFFEERAARMRLIVEDRAYAAAADGDAHIELSCSHCSAGKLIIAEPGMALCPLCGHRTEFRTCSRCQTASELGDWDSFSQETGVCPDCVSCVLDESD